MPAPEALARQEIDGLLQASGWAVQDRREADLGASLGVAIREFPTAAGPADYLLFADRKMIGVVEAKPAGTTLSGVADQSAGYIAGVSGHTARWRDPLPFSYESTGVETFFTSGLDPVPRARRVFSFHRPETLIEWAKETAPLRARLRHRRHEMAAWIPIDQEALVDFCRRHRVSSEPPPGTRVLVPILGA